MTTTMRDRFDYVYKKDLIHVSDIYLFLELEEKLKEQELKKERDEIVEIVNKKRMENTEQTPSGYVYKSSEIEQNCKDIINTIKNRV